MFSTWVKGCIMVVRTSGKVTARVLHKMTGLGNAPVAVLLLLISVRFHMLLSSMKQEMQVQSTVCPSEPHSHH